MYILSVAIKRELKLGTCSGDAGRLPNIGEFFRVRSEHRACFSLWAFPPGRYYSRKRCIRVWGDHEKSALPQPFRNPFEHSTSDACLLSCWISHRTFPGRHWEIWSKRFIFSRLWSFKEFRKFKWGLHGNLKFWVLYQKLHMCCKSVTKGTASIALLNFFLELIFSPSHLWE